MLALLPLLVVHGYTLTERDVDPSLLGGLMLGLFLLSLSSYGLGLQLGLMKSRSLALISAVIVLTALFMLLLFVKGLRGDSFALLLLVSMLFLTRAWCRFRVLSL